MGPLRRLVVAVVQAPGGLVRRRLAAAGLAFAEQPHPLVSVLIAMYGRPGVTLDALQALMRIAAEAPIEVLLCDDHSPDDSGCYFEAVPGLRLRKNRENIGYLRSNNLLAGDARAEFLLLLNNDTVIQRGALSALLAVFGTHPDAGLVGARLMFPDGRLQEAGAVVSRNGSAKRRGWKQRDEPTLYNTIEEVDYCSAAAVLIRRQLFLDLGGFDELYLPAYYEDVDLAFKVRSAGYKVYFQPAARVIHIENASSSLRRAKIQASVNLPKFRERWGVVLDAGDHPSARSLRPSGAGGTSD